MDSAKASICFDSRYVSAQAEDARNILANTGIAVEMRGTNSRFKRIMLHAQTGRIRLSNLIGTYGAANYGHLDSVGVTYGVFYREKVRREQAFRAQNPGYPKSCIIVLFYVRNPRVADDLSAYNLSRIAEIEASGEVIDPLQGEAAIVTDRPLASMGIAEVLLVLLRICAMLLSQSIVRRPGHDALVLDSGTELYITPRRSALLLTDLPPGGAERHSPVSSTTQSESLLGDPWWMELD